MSEFLNIENWFSLYEATSNKEPLKTQILESIAAYQDGQPYPNPFYGNEDKLEKELKRRGLE